MDALAPVPTKSPAKIFQQNKRRLEEIAAKDAELITQLADAEAEVVRLKKLRHKLYAEKPEVERAPSDAKSRLIAADFAGEAAGAYATLNPGVPLEHTEAMSRAMSAYLTEMVNTRYKAEYES